MSIITYFLINPCHAEKIKMLCPLLIFSQSDYFRLLIQIHILNDKQSRSRSVGFFRSQLIWIYTVCKVRVHPGSAGLGIRKNSYLHAYMYLLTGANSWISLLCGEIAYLQLETPNQTLLAFILYSGLHISFSSLIWKYRNSYTLSLVLVSANIMILCWRLILTLVLLNLDMSCLCKQCRSEEANWSGSALFAIE